MTNITPADRRIWNKKMADHAKRMKRTPTRAIVWLILAVILVGVTGVLYTITHQPVTVTRDPETVLNDTIQMNAGDLSRDSSLDSMRKTPAGREYDSIVRAQETIDSINR